MSWKENVIMTWDGHKVSDHGRSPLTIDIERIERKERMVDGTMRKHVVAKKRTFSCTWDNLPSRNVADSGTVDNGMSGTDMENFHDETDDPFELVLRNGQGQQETYQVYIDSFSWDIAKRGYVDLWNVEVTLVEV